MITPVRLTPKEKTSAYEFYLVPAAHVEEQLSTNPYRKGEETNNEENLSSI